MNLMFSRHGFQAGVTHVHPHRFRHTFATRALVRIAQVAPPAGPVTRGSSPSRSIYHSHREIFDVPLGDEGYTGPGRCDSESLVLCG